MKDLGEVLFDIKLLLRDFTPTVFFYDWLTRVHKITEFKVKATAVDYSTVGVAKELVLCTNTTGTIRITVHTPVNEHSKDTVIIKRLGLGDVEYINSAKGVDGDKTAISLASQYDSAYLMGTTEADEWSKLIV